MSMPTQQLVNRRQAKRLKRLKKKTSSKFTKQLLNAKGFQTEHQIIEERLRSFKQDLQDLLREAVDNAVKQAKADLTARHEGW